MKDEQASYKNSSTPVQLRLSGVNGAISQRSLGALRPRQSEFVTKILQAPSIRQLTCNSTNDIRMSSFVSRCSSFGAGVPMLEDEENVNPFDEESNGLSQFDALKVVVHKLADADGAIDKKTFINTFGVDLPDPALDSIRCASILLTAAMEMDLEDDEKLRLIFDTMDVHLTGRIDRNDVADLLKAKFTSVKLKCVGTDFEALADVLFKKARAAKHSHINYIQFSHVFRDYIKDVNAVAELKAAESTCPRQVATISISLYFYEWYQRNRMRLWWLILYISFSLYQGISKGMVYPVDSAVGWSLRIARGMAQISMSNMFLAILPMCRSVVEIIKQHTILGNYIPFDDILAFHRIAGAVSLFSGLIHTGAHVYNEIYLYLIVTPNQIRRSYLVEHVSTLRGLNGEILLPPFSHMVFSLPILTGVVMLIITLIVIPTAMISSIRKNNFNLFWYSHMLLGIFLICGSIHGMMSWLATAQSYWWILPVFLIYLIERRVRILKYFKSYNPIRIQSAILYKSTGEDTLALFMEKPTNFRYRPGMYTFLNVPAISSHEWHPFTISSAPCDPYISLHIRKAGDWTSKLHEIMDNNTSYPKVYLDGPIGAPTQAYSKYKTIIMIGGGIGITPFASVLKDIVIEMKSRNNGGRIDPDFLIEKLYFHWTTRNQDSLRWFQNTMNELHHLDTNHMFETHQHLTSIKDTPECMKLFQAMYHDETGQDVVSGLTTKQLTHFGRPKWNDIFNELSNKHHGEIIGVFFCGPHQIDIELEKLCKKYTNAMTKTCFEYHSEKFT